MSLMGVGNFVTISGLIIITLVIVSSLGLGNPITEIFKDIFGAGLCLVGIGVSMYVVGDLKRQPGEKPL